MVGLRVFDVGALIVWLVWFFRLREDDVGVRVADLDRRPRQPVFPTVTRRGKLGTALASNSASAVAGATAVSTSTAAKIAGFRRSPAPIVLTA